MPGRHRLSQGHRPPMQQQENGFWDELLGKLTLAWSRAQVPSAKSGVTTPLTQMIDSAD